MNSFECSTRIKMKSTILYIALIVVLHRNGIALSEATESCTETWSEKQQCESYILRVTKPLLTQIQNDKLELSECLKKILNLEAMLAQSKKEQGLCQSKVKEIELGHQNEQENLTLCQNEDQNLYNTTENPKALDIRKIQISKLGTIEVLFDNTLEIGDGWIVIQQRVDGKTDFYKDWSAYRNGFGTFDGDFFLGLEKIHQLTMDRNHELYIHMRSFDGEIKYARYDHFQVGSEAQNYKLNSLGEFSSNGLDDMLRWHQHQMFTTYDRKNDNWADGNCAVDAHGGWWYNACASSNLNGKYSNVAKTGFTTVYWAHYVALKEVKMLIRAKSV